MIDPARLPPILVIAFALYVGWGYMSGRRGRVPLYIVALIVAGCLPAAAIAELLGLAGAVETFNVAAISLALAALVSPPRMWELQLRDDWEHAQVYQPIRAADFTSWRAWLKAVHHVGARSAALLYFGIFVVGLILQVLVSGFVQPDVALWLFLALLLPVAFAGVSAVWIYQGVRRVMPGA